MTVTVRSTSVLLLLAAVVVFVGCSKQTPDADSNGTDGPLRMVVMDPLCAQLACDCVNGYAQRRYDLLGAFLKEQLGCDVRINYTENLAEILTIEPGAVDLIIGKRSVVLFDTARAGLNVRQVAMLTDKTGSVNVEGLFVVRADDPAKSISDLGSYGILFGPESETEKSAAAMAALKAAKVTLPDRPRRIPSCSTASLAVAEKDADVTIISSYALPLLEGCSTIDKGSLRVIGRTKPAGFITAFVGESVSTEYQKRITDALVKMKENKPLLKAMESRDGFIRAQSLPVKSSGAFNDKKGWPDWRGVDRDGISPDVPERLPAKAKFLWRKKLTGLAPAGIAAADGFVIVADKDEAKEHDIFRCLDADSGRQMWQIKYRAAPAMDYSNSPRATPVICGDLVYLLGAFADLNCVKLHTGEIVWSMNIVEQFNAELVTWGASSTPLVIGDKLIVNPGAKDASIVALDRFTGKVIWKTAGVQASYSSFIVGEFGGVKQFVGYDAISIGGWDVETGMRLWTVLPEIEGDFNVPTLAATNGRILAVTENNGARLYAFTREGIINPEPLWQNMDLSPDCSTPIIVDGLIFGEAAGLYCLDVEDGRTRWSVDDDAFYDYMTLIAGNGRVLMTTVEGELVLFEASAAGYRAISRLELFDKVEVWSHPALAGNRLFIRTQDEICCVLLD